MAPGFAEIQDAQQEDLLAAKKTACFPGFLPTKAPVMFGEAGAPAKSHVCSQGWLGDLSREWDFDRNS